MASLGDMVVRIVGDMTDFNKAIDASEAKFKAATSNFQKLGANLTKFVTLPVLGIGTAFTKVASDSEETSQKFRVVFRDIAVEAEESAQRLSDSFDISSTTARKLLGDTGDLLTGFGFTQEAALDLANQVNTLAIDLASFTNFAGGAEGASVALTKALLGESEQAKALGIVIRQDSEEYINLVDYYMKAEGATLLQAKALTALRISANQSKNAIGDYARTSQGLANQTRALKEDIKDLSVEFGNRLIPTALKVVATVRDLAKYFTDLDTPTKDAIIQYGLFAAATGPVILGIVKLIDIVPKLGIVLTTLAAHPVVAAMIALSAAILVLGINIDKANAEAEILNQIMNGSPVGTFAQDLKAVNKELEALYDAKEASGLLFDENSELAKQIRSLETIQKQMIDKDKWAAMNVRGQALMNKEIDKEVLSQDEITKAIEARAKVTERYLGVRTKVLDIIDSEKTEYQKIQDQIDELERSPWASSKLETDRLAAVQILRNRQAVILDEELKQRIENEAEATEKLRQSYRDSLSEYQASRDGMILASEDLFEMEKGISDAVDRGNQKRSENELARIEKEKQARIDSARFAYSTLFAIADQLSANEIANIEAADDKQLKSLEDQLELAKGNAELEKQLAQDIQDVKDATAKKVAQARVKQAKWDKAQALIDVAINTAVAVTKALPNVILAGIVGALGLAQAGVVAAQPLPPVPLAQGGVVMPTPGGTLAQIAEAGQPEAVIPLDRFDQLGGDIHLVVNLDSKPFLDKIFPATRNRQILISAGAIV